VTDASLPADDVPVEDVVVTVDEPRPNRNVTDEEVVLAVRDLRVEFPTDDGVVKAVDGVSFEVRRAETLGIVGESGSGKSVSSLAILGLLPKSARISGSIEFKGEQLLGKSDDELRQYRGSSIAMIFQDALAALNPVFTVGEQISEAILVHNEIPEKEVRLQVIELLDIVGIPAPAKRFDQYPHEFSGGMRQRAMIAMAISNEPDLLIADEPTTALDVTIQAQVLEVIERIQDRTRSSVLLITHDLGVVAGLSDRVMVMYAGRQAELGSVDDIFYAPAHPYTRGLLASLPRLDRAAHEGKLYRIKGQPPSLIRVPPGCPFQPRCPVATPVGGICTAQRPELIPVADAHSGACHFAATLDERYAEVEQEEAAS
jgi:oligopeptide/dipeptide ABC transporter ATP-binding protein